MAAKVRGNAESRWRALIAEQERSGAGVAEFARSRRLPPASLYWWRSELRRRDRRAPMSPTFVPVTLMAGEDSHEEEGGFELVLAHGRRVRVPSRFDADALARLISIVERAC